MRPLGYVCFEYASTATYTVRKPSWYTKRATLAAIYAAAGKTEFSPLDTYVDRFPYQSYIN